MENFFKQWCEQLRHFLRPGDIRLISETTGIKYNIVCRMFSDGVGGKKGEIETCFNLAHDLITKRAQADLQLSSQFDQAYNLEKEIEAEKAALEKKRRTPHHFDGETLITV